MNKVDINKTNSYLSKHIPLVMHSDVEKMVMYGSCARGDYTEESDLDIAILTNCSRLEAKKYDDSLMDIVTDIAMDIGTNVQYVCIPKSEFDAKKTWYGYFKNIEKDGVTIYG